MPTGLKDKEDQRNPGQNSWDQKVDRNQAAASSLSGSEQGALDEIEANFDQNADPSQEDSNINSVKNAEESPNNYDKTPTETTKKTDARKPSRRQRALNFAKRKGPLSLILMIFIGGGGILTSLSSTGLGLVQFKNTLVQDLNDAMPSLDERGNHIMRAKMKDRTRGFCTSKVSFRCKYKSVSKKHAQKLVRQGFTLENRRVNKFGRVVFDGLTFREPGHSLRAVTGADGITRSEPNKPIKVTPQNFKNVLRSNLVFQSKLMKSFNPRFEALRNKVAGKVYTKFKVPLTRALNGPKEAMKKQFNDIVRRGVDEVDGRRIHKRTVNGETVYEDSNGRRVNNLTDAQKTAIDSDNGQSKIKGFEGKNHGLKGMLQNGFRASNMLIGADLMLCHTLGMIEITSLAAKNIKFAQLIRYVVPLLNTADSIKSGDGIMEAVSFMGDTLTHVDLREESLDENGDTLGEILGPEGEYNGDLNNIEIETEENPHYGKNAFDSAGYKLAAYGEVGNLDMRESQYKLGGTFGGNKLSSLVDRIKSTTIGFSKEKCDFYENPIVMGATFAISIVGLFGTGGTGFIVQSAKLGVMMIGFTLIQTYLRGMVDEIVKGELADADTKGIDAGNAFFSGGAALMGSLASSNGLNPLSTNREISQSQRIAAKHKQRYAEVARYDARDTPFDIYNQYSFLGSIASKMYPAAISANSFAATVLASPLAYLSTAVSALYPSASASITSPMARYEKCEDPSFEDINLQSADQMCNIRFGNSPDELHADPEKVADWMVDAGQIDQTTGEVISTQEAVEKVAQIPVTSQEASTVLHNEDDPNPPAQIVSVDRSNPNDTSVKLAAVDFGKSERYPIEPEAEKNVRTYAHWLRYCRFGDDEGRNVNFGDQDSSGDESILTGITNQAYLSDGRECLKSNSCSAGQNPNGTPYQSEEDDEWYVEGDGIDAMKDRCRPPQYSIYSIFHIDQSVIDSMEMEEDEPEGATGTISIEDAKEAAQALLDSPNVRFQTPAQRGHMEQTAATGMQNGCKGPTPINGKLLGMLVEASKKYQITIGSQTAGRGCDGGHHPNGDAVDINGVAHLGDPPITRMSSSGAPPYPADQQPIIKEFDEFVDAMAGKANMRLEIGQANCFTIAPPTLPHSKFVADTCHHIHLGVEKS